MANVDQLRELIELCPDVKSAVEAGVQFYFLPMLRMPAGVVPAQVDALLCPTERDGYASRLFLSTQVSGCKKPLNWNGQIRILERNWFAVSWRTAAGLRLAQMVLVHLDAFR